MSLHEVEQTALTIDVVVGQIELGDPGAGQAQSVFRRIAGDQQVLDDPVDLGAHQGEVPRADSQESSLPQVQDGFVDRVVQALAVNEIHGALEVLVLDLKRAQLTAIGELDSVSYTHLTLPTILRV